MKYLPFSIMAAVSNSTLCRLVFSSLLKTYGHYSTKLREISDSSNESSLDLV